MIPEKLPRKKGIWKLHKPRGYLPGLKRLPKGEPLPAAMKRKRNRVAGLASAIRTQTHNGAEIARFFRRVMQGRRVLSAGQLVFPALAQRIYAANWLAERGFGGVIPMDVLENLLTPTHRLPDGRLVGGLGTSATDGGRAAVVIDQRQLQLSPQALEALTPEEREVARKLLMLSRPVLPAMQQEEESPGTP